MLSLRRPVWAMWKVLTWKMKPVVSVKSRSLGTGLIVGAGDVGLIGPVALASAKAVSTTRPDSIVATGTRAPPGPIGTSTMELSVAIVITPSALSVVPNKFIVASTVIV